MPSLKQAFTGGLFLIGDSIGKKLIGLLSTLLLARLLTPDDYGIVALAVIAFGLIEILSNTGAEKYLITRDKIDNEQIFTAFTLNLIIKSIFSLSFLTLSTFLAGIFGEERLVNIFIVMSVIIFITGFDNLGLVILKREQEYKNIVIVTVISKIISVLAAVTVAIIYKNYWALIIGQFIAYTLPVIGGYFISNFRPSLSLSNLKEQFRYSGWLIPSDFFSYIRGNIDIFLVNRLFDTAAVGGYHVMKYLAYMPVAFFIGPMTSPILAQLSHLKNNEDYFNKMHSVSIYFTCLVAAPISMFIFTFSQEIVSFVLGSQWIVSHVLLKIFSLMIFLTPFFNQIMNVSYIKSKTNILFILELIMVVTTVLVLTQFEYANNVSFAFAKVMLDLFFVFGVTLLTNTIFRGAKSLIPLFLVISPIMLSSYLSAALAKFLSLSFESGVDSVNYLITLTFSGFIYFISYFFLMFIFLVIFKKRFFEVDYVYLFIKKIIQSINFTRKDGVN